MENILADVMAVVVQAGIVALVAIAVLLFNHVKLYLISKLSASQLELGKQLTGTIVTYLEQVRVQYGWTSEELKEKALVQLNQAFGKYKLVFSPDMIDHMIEEAVHLLPPSFTYVESKLDFVGE